MRFHKLQNVQIALEYLKHRQVSCLAVRQLLSPVPFVPPVTVVICSRQVKLVNIRNDDIADGNPKLTLGLIWTIILHFQVREAAAARGGGGSSGGSAWPALKALPMDLEPTC